MAQQLSEKAESAPAAIVGLEARIGAHTDVGQVRGNNEDRLLVFDLNRRQPFNPEGMVVLTLQPAGVLLIVADGMGGMAGGEQASQMCIEQLPALLLQRLEQRAATRLERQQALIEAIQETNQFIYSHASADDRLRGMGTTLTAALVEEGYLSVAQVGDSRAYVLRAGELVQLTRDQTMWETFRETAQLPDTAFGKASWKNKLLQALGAQPEVQVAITETPFDAADWLMLCTDGLHRAVAEEEIADVMHSQATPAEKARELTARANQYGGPDNVSVIVCQVGNISERATTASLGV